MATKWQLHRLYMRHPNLRTLLPPTALLTPSSLANFLNRYGTVYIKGSNQHTGRGVVKAWKSPNGYHFVRVRSKPIYAGSVLDLYQKVKRGNPGQRLLVQKAIPLARIRRQPYDIRVMMMRDGQLRWQYAGMLAKVAGRGSVISNVRRGMGYALTVDRALAQSLGYGQARIAAIKRELVRLGFEIVRYSTRSGYRSHETGVDMGIDRNGKLWLIEANLIYPSHGLFNRLTDKTFYRRIKQLSSQYRSRSRK